MDRRGFLRYIGAGAAAWAGAGGGLGPLARSARAAAPPSTPAGQAWVRPDGTPTWSPVRYPVPLPGDPTDVPDAQRLASHIVRDDLVLPDGFRWDLIAQWGDPIQTPDGPARVGFNHDYTGLVPIADRPGHYWLIVNHEYISARPWLAGYAAAHGQALQLTDPPARICTAAMSDLGVSILHVQRHADGRFTLVTDAADHKRISGITRPVGTFANCSGETTPWGTFHSCEENFQDQVPDALTPEGEIAPFASQPFRQLGVGMDGIDVPFEFEGLGAACDPPLDGRDFGWVVHVAPSSGAVRKLRGLGRFRHENVALRCEAGKRLTAYMGDDRRGGHVWKFVSDAVVTDPRDPGNVELLERGTLYAAKFDGDYTGRWIALRPDTPVVTPEPAHCSTGHLWLPQRPVGGAVAVGTPGASAREITVKHWLWAIQQFTGKPLEQTTLGDLVRGDGQAVILADAYLMANAAGATPTARPEDVEVHPLDRSVYIAFTDSTGSGDGSPDVRIFPDSRGDNSRQYGAIYRLVEHDDDPAAEAFTWGKFVAAGECAEGGGGFACADNLAFDPQGNLWMVTDISTLAHNFPVNREGSTSPGDKGFPGVFGNNALFMIPTTGEHAGVPFCFAIGPMECELTGPTFTPDGKTLILSVQHPGERYGPRAGNAHADEERQYRIAARDGSIFTQTRTVPRGSNFPSGQPGEAPRPCVVCIVRSAE